jgi:hypothetical protein
MKLREKFSIEWCWVRWDFSFWKPDKHSSYRYIIRWILDIGPLAITRWETRKVSEIKENESCVFSK